MKFLEKVHIKEGVLVKIFSLFVCLYLFNLLSCGLDMFYSIEAPTSYEIPSYTNTEYTSQTFIFYTNETWFPDAENPAYKFKGTDVYYKIYTSLTTFKNELSTIETLLDSESTSYLAAEKLIAYNYATLKIDGLDETYLIPSSAGNRVDREVKIRLTNYQDLDEYKAIVTVSGVEKGKPIRNISSASLSYTFDFGRSGDGDLLPQDGDSDLSYTSSTASNLWYVAMYAVARGFDPTLSAIYSVPVYIGSVTIDSDLEDN
ncbi:MAG: hypothetical protein K6D95_04095 [Treponema sp.]|jgi:hypothetical protein|nr:hypothetical protein [Treponema sp.]